MKKENNTVKTEEEVKVEEKAEMTNEKEETPVKGKDVKIFGMKVHVEKAEKEKKVKKEKKTKEPKEPKEKNGKKLAIGAAGAGLLALGIAGKVLFDKVKSDNPGGNECTEAEVDEFPEVNSDQIEPDELETETAETEI